MEIRDFFGTIGRHRVLFSLLFLLILGTGAAAAFLRADRFKATATVIGEPPNGRADFNSVQAVQFLLPAVVDAVGTDSFKSSVAAALPSGTSLSNVSIGASLEQGTGILRISAQSRNRGAVTPAANTAAQVLVSRPFSPNLKLAILDPAHRAVSTAASLRAPIIVSSFVLGLIIAAFGVLIRNSFDRRLRSSDDLDRQFGLEILGEIPELRHFPNSPMELFAEPKHANAAEAYQRLVANLEVSLAATDVQTIAITSTAGGEGKTTVTTFLAWTLALLGHRVVAIDGDLRKPTLHRRLEIDSTAGLADVNNGNAASLLRRTPLESLAVMAAGQAALHPAQVVNRQLPEVLTSFPGRLVLIDTPPALVAAEATLIAMMAKHVILVVDQNTPSSEDIARVLHELRRADVKVLGVVVNRAKSRQLSGYGDYYVPIPPPAARAPRVDRGVRHRASRRRSRNASGD